MYEQEGHRTRGFVVDHIKPYRGYAPVPRADATDKEIESFYQDNLA